MPDASMPVREILRRRRGAGGWVSAGDALVLGLRASVAFEARGSPRIWVNYTWR
jgi:hypothetical protein